MGWQLPSRVVFLTLVFASFCLMAAIDNASGVSVKLLDTPPLYSQNTTAAFSFESEAAASDGACGCSTILICRLDCVFSECDSGRTTYFDLDDGQHIFEVCVSGSSQDCASYSWTIDTVPPTAKVTASTWLTSDLNVSVNISFSEPCSFGGSFGCSSADSCNLKVQGPGEVIPSSLEFVESNLKYKLLVSLASSKQYENVTIFMDRDFCADAAGNKFTPTPRDEVRICRQGRSNASSSLNSQIPKKLFELNGQMKSVQATNNHDNLKFDLYLSEPVVNSSAQILQVLNTSEGILVPIDGGSLGNQTFHFMVTNVTGSFAVINVSFMSLSILTPQGTVVSPIAPLTILYDTERPDVSLSTSKRRYREDKVSISIQFAKPVLGFNCSNITISGGRLRSFRLVNLTNYAIEVQADGGRISVNIPENAAEDLAGNKNRPSKPLKVWQDSTPAVSVVASSLATASFLGTSFASGLLIVSTATLQVTGASASSGLTLQPSSNMFRMLSYIQVFALSRRLMETPNEYYELARRLQWSIPHYSLPWDRSSNTGLNKTMLIKGSTFKLLPRNLRSGKPAPISFPASVEDYRSTIKALHENSYLDENDEDKYGWKEFGNIMGPLAITTGSTLLVHYLLVLLLKFKRKKSTEKPSNYGALTFPRIEIFLLFEAIPGVCEGSAALIHGKTSLEVVVGCISLFIVLFVLLALLLFLLVCVTYGKLLRYKEEVRQEGQQFNCFRQIWGLILGPGENGRWTWEGHDDSVYLTMFGLLFEDLRGPQRLAPSQISRRGGGRVIAFKNAAAAFLRNMLGSLTVYYTLIESMKRACLGILAGASIKNWFYRDPAITVLCINCFQLFYLVLEKPFIERRAQLVHTISLASEVGLYASGVAFKDMEFSKRNETVVGYLMVGLFLAGMLVLLANEVYGLYSEVKKLDHPHGRSFFKGLKVAMNGIRSLFTFSSSSSPQPEAVGTETQDPVTGAGPSSEGNSKSSFRKSKRTSSGTDPLAVAPLAAIQNLEDTKSAIKDAEEIGSSSPFTDNIEAQIEDPLAVVAPPEAIPNLEAASTQTQTGVGAKSASKDAAEEIGSAPSSKNNVEFQTEDIKDY